MKLKTEEEKKNDIEEEENHSIKSLVIIKDNSEDEDRVYNEKLDEVIIEPD